MGPLGVKVGFSLSGADELPQLLWIQWLIVHILSLHPITFLEHSEKFPRRSGLGLVRVRT